MTPIRMHIHYACARQVPSCTVVARDKEISRGVNFHTITSARETRTAAPAISFRRRARKRTAANEKRQRPMFANVSATFSRFVFNTGMHDFSRKVTPRRHRTVYRRRELSLRYCRGRKITHLSLVTDVL